MPSRNQNNFCRRCVCLCVCVSETISRALIGRKSATSPGIVQHSQIRRTLWLMTLMKATYLLQQENKTNKGRLSLAVPHSDLSTTLNIFISGVSSRIMIIEPNIKLNIEPEVLAFQQRYVRSWASTSISAALRTFLWVPSSFLQGPTYPKTLRSSCKAHLHSSSLPFQKNSILHIPPK